MQAVLPDFIYDCLVQKSDQIVKLGVQTMSRSTPENYKVLRNS